MRVQVGYPSYVRGDPSWIGAYESVFPAVVSLAPCLAALA
jgi:hypothetical protein